MTTQVLRARTVGELVDAAFSLYRKDAPTYIMVAAIASAPGLLTQLLTLGGDPSGAQAVGAIITLLISIVTYSLMTGVTMRVGSDVYLGGEADVAGAVRSVLPRTGALVATGILKGFLYMLWSLLFGIGFFYAASRWFAPEAAVVLEGKDSSAALARSTALAEGRKWHIFRTLLLGYGIYFVLMIGIVGVSAVLGSELITLIVQTLFVVVAYPIIGLLTMLLYYDARIRAEGFDVEHLSRSLGTVPAR